MLQTRSTAWFGIGFGNAMNKAQDMWIFQVDKANNKIYATDSFSKDYAPPSNDLNFGGTNDIVLLGQEYDVGGLTTVKFRRSLDTGDVNDIILEKKVQSAMWAIGIEGDYDVKYHGQQKGLFTVDMSES